MSKDFYYVREVSSRSKVKIFIITVASVVVLLGLIIVFNSIFESIIGGIPGLNGARDHIAYEIKELTPAGLFYGGFLGGLFFVPIPQEIFFYYGLIKGNPILVSLLTINSGFLLSQLVNYWFGSKLNKFFFSIISKKKLYKARRFINKRGGLGIFLFNLLPLPAPLLTFALGIAKYNLSRLFFYTILGTAVKYAVIISFFIITQG